MGVSISTLLQNYSQNSLYKINENYIDQSPYSDYFSLDLNKLPVEIAYEILKNLNATDLCLAACVWNKLAYSCSLWRKLCISQWPFIKDYELEDKNVNFDSYFQLYLIMDESKLIFNTDSNKGIEFLKKKNILRTEKDIAQYLFHTKELNNDNIWLYLSTNHFVLGEFIGLINYSGQCLPLGLKLTFLKISSNGLKMPFNTLEFIVDSFSQSYLRDNPDFPFDIEKLFLLSFSLIVLYEDLNCPHVKNKMSKREFIKNTKNATGISDREFLGFIYDEVYTGGLIQEKCNYLPVFNPSTVPLDRIIKF